MSRSDGKVVYVTGSARGIGRATCNMKPIKKITPDDHRRQRHANVAGTVVAKLEHREIAEKKQFVSEAVPLGLMKAPEETADPWVFLASDAARHITSQTSTSMAETG